MLRVVQRHAVVQVTVGGIVDVIDGVDDVAVDERAPGAVVMQMLTRQHRQRQQGGDRTNRDDDSAGVGARQAIKYREGARSIVKILRRRRA